MHHELIFVLHNIYSITNRLSFAIESYLIIDQYVVVGDTVVDFVLRFQLIILFISRIIIWVVFLVFIFSCLLLLFFFNIIINTNFFYFWRKKKRKKREFFVLVFL